MQQPDKLTVVIAHRDPFLSAGLARHLDNLAEFEPVVSGAELGAAITGSDSADVVVADYDSGLRFLGSNSRCRDRVVIFTERDSEASICHAMEQGVRGYLLLGCGVADVTTAIRTVHEGGRALAPLVASRIVERISWEKLTPRELDILQLLSLGLRDKEIARATSRATETVKTHVKAIFRKLDARSRTQAVMVARRRGILLEEVSDRMRPRANSRGGLGDGCGPSVPKPGGFRDQARLGNHFRQATGKIPATGRRVRWTQDSHLFPRQSTRVAGIPGSRLLIDPRSDLLFGSVHEVPRVAGETLKP